MPSLTGVHWHSGLMRRPLRPHIINPRPLQMVVRYIIQKGLFPVLMRILVKMNGRSGWTWTRYFLTRPNFFLLHRPFTFSQPVPVVFSSIHLSFPNGASYASGDQGSRPPVCYRQRNRTTHPLAAGLSWPWRSYRTCRPSVPADRYVALVVTVRGPSHPG